MYFGIKAYISVSCPGLKKCFYFLAEETLWLLFGARYRKSSSLEVSVLVCGRIDCFRFPLRLYLYFYGSLYFICGCVHD